MSVLLAKPRTVLRLNNVSPLNEGAMSRRDHPKKTLARKLRDLEDHLHFLNESLAKLVSGDEAYLRNR